MRINFASRILSIAFAISVLLILGSIQRQVHAQPTESITFIYGSFGIAPNETVRYTWMNRNDPDPLRRLFEPLRIRVRLLAGDGSVIAQQEAAAVGAGRSQSFDFDRDQISLPGEPGTGRIQARLEPTLIVVFSRTGNIANHSILNSFGDSIEVFDNVSGRTTVSLGGGFNAMIVDDTSGRQYFNPEAFQIISAGKDHLIGIAPDQILRVTVVHPGGQTGPTPPDVSVGVWIVDSSGRVISQSPQVQIPPRQFSIFDFNPLLLPMPGEPGTGRKQVLVRVVNNDAPVSPTEFFVSSMELMGPTGRTKTRIQSTNNLRQMTLGAQ
jgi:hypothetical protein